MFKKLREFRARLRLYRMRDKVHSDLDAILDSAQDLRHLEDKLAWLVRLMQWIRYEAALDSHMEREIGRIPTKRLRFLLMVLERNRRWKKDVAVILRTVIREVSGLELFTETGLAKELGLWSELSNRLMLKMLPPPPLDHELGYLFWSLFPGKKDSLWIASIDSDTFDQVLELFNYEVSSEEHDWNRLRFDLEDALVYLVIQVRAVGLSPAIRNRLDKPSFRDSAFFALVRGLEEFLSAYHSRDQEQTFDKASRFRLIVWECRQELDQVLKHLDEYGVSINLVFQMMRLRSYLQRIDSLLEILLNEKVESKKVMSFLSKLVQENQDLRSLSTLVSQNVSLFARKMVERAAETGEHYITRTKEQYRQMLAAAGGGGVVTAVTVYIKIGILLMGVSGFMEGALASLNYALSFVIIHLLGFTLGTKQPAMTAPALANKMQDVESEKGMDELVTEITHLIRSQVASILGNVLFVIPTVLLIDTAFFLLSGSHIVSSAKAHAAYRSVDIVGLTVLFAAFTGILLWLSSLIAGWGDNWFALNSLRKTLARSPALTFVFGRHGARRIALFLEKNMSALVGNISLGILLGMTPELMKFMGIPLEVRHVTLASGTLAAAIPSLGSDFLYSWYLVRAILGIMLIGFLNVSVSFGMALLLALKARNINPPQRKAIRKAVVKRFLSQPFSFFLPVGVGVTKGSQETGASH
jgi:site-specific recombinase